MYVRFQAVIEEWVKTLWFSEYYPEKIHLETYDHVTPYLNAALIPCNRFDQGLVPKKMCSILAIWCGNHVMRSKFFNGGCSVGGVL